MRIHKQRRPARRTKLVHTFLLHEPVALDVIFAAVEDDVRLPGIDIEVAVLAAYGAVAAGDLLGLERRRGDFVLDGPAVAVGFVPDFSGGFGIRHGRGFGFELWI